MPLNVGTICQICFKYPTTVQLTKALVGVQAHHKHNLKQTKTTNPNKFKPQSERKPELQRIFAIRQM